MTLKYIKHSSALTGPDVYKFMLNCKLYEKYTFKKHPVFLLPGISPFHVIQGHVSDINNGLKHMHPRLKLYAS